MPSGNGRSSPYGARGLDDVLLVFQDMVQGDGDDVYVDHSREEGSEVRLPTSILQGEPMESVIFQRAQIKYDTHLAYVERGCVSEDEPNECISKDILLVYRGNLWQRASNTFVQSI